MERGKLVRAGGACVAVIVAACAGAANREPPAQVDAGPTRMKVTLHEDGTSAVERVPVTSKVTGELTASKPDECTEPRGLLLELACAGGGRPLLEGFLERAGERFGADEARLIAIAAKMPAASFDETFTRTLDRAFRKLVHEHAPRLFSDARNAARFANEIRGADDAALHRALREPGLHYNAANGLLGVQTLLDDCRDHAKRRAQARADFGWDDARSDEVDARNLGESLGQVAFAMSVSGYSTGELISIYAARP